jgi:indole-3-glycerol phosphate synthase
MAALTEIHDRDDLEKAIECEADVIGINNRDLDSFVVDTRTTHKLARYVPKECVLVSESGIEKSEDIPAMKDSGVQAVLIGSALMRSGDIAEKTKEMVKAGAGLKARNA